MVRARLSHHGRWLPGPRTEAMTPLRQRFIHDLQLRNYSPRTIQTYTEAIVRFARHFGRSPEKLGPAEIRAYQLYLLHERHASWSAFNQVVSALRLLYRLTLPRPFLVEQVPYGKKPKSLPAVLVPTRDRFCLRQAAVASRREAAEGWAG